MLQLALIADWVVLQTALLSMCVILICSISLELFFSGLVNVFILSCLSSLFYGLLPDSNKWSIDL